MKKSSWKKQHKWFGILLFPFIILFALSGILLNHRDLISSLDVSRSFLPADFHYKKWNNGLFKGTLKLDKGSGTLFIYGNGGVFKQEVGVDSIVEFNEGFPQGVDNRNIQAMHEMVDGTVYALSQYKLFYLKDSHWVPCFTSPGERLVDLFEKDNKLYILSRSFVYAYKTEQRIELQAPKGYKEQVSLFKTIWLLHSGELFGLFGKLVVDIIGLILIMVSITGLLFWLLPKHIRRLKRSGKRTKRSLWLLRSSFNWHNNVGKYTFILLLFVSITGWCLRPPLLIPLAKTEVSPIAGTTLQHDNPWHDKLRKVEFDTNTKEWLLSTSKGFYTFKAFDDTPLLVVNTPPVSVMGITVMHQKADGVWLIGSFSGLFSWDRSSGTILDYFTGHKPQSATGIPFGKRAISGFSADLSLKNCIVEYEDGTSDLVMPNSFEGLPISLWHIALEVHTGRIYTVLGAGTLVYITFAGLLVIWVLVTGYRIRKKKKRG